MSLLDNCKKCGAHIESDLTFWGCLNGSIHDFKEERLERGAMNQKQYFQEFVDLCSDMIETTKAKNSDYAKSENAFANFENSANVAGVSVERGILIRMADKMSRIGNLLDKEAQVKEESIDDTLKDLAIYATILRIYRRYKLNEASPKQYDPARNVIGGQLGSRSSEI